MPKVTVLMSVYNGEKYLREAIDSVLAQTYRDFEFLIINDASTDSSKKIILSYKDPRINYLGNETNIGLTRSLNKGLDLAKGEYLARMDADDVCLPRRLEKQVRFMDENPGVGACGTWFRFIPSRETVEYPARHKEIRLKLLTGNALGHPTAMLRTGLLRGNKVHYDERLEFTQDYELWVRLSKMTELANIPEVLLDYRACAGQLSNLNEKKQDEIADTVKLGQLADLGVVLSEEERRVYLLLLKNLISKEADLRPAEIIAARINEANSAKRIYEPAPLAGKLLSLLSDARKEIDRRLISVIVPCYNSGRTLAETLDSVRAQSFQNWECIIVDDGSKDDTKEVAGKYTAADKRFRYLYQENKGLPSARNAGIRTAAGGLIQLLDADDLITPDKFSAQMAAFEERKEIDVFYSGYLCFSDNDRQKTWTYSRVELIMSPARDFAACWEKGLSIPINCFLFQKRCFDRWGLFDERFVYGKEDWDLHLKFSCGGAKYLFTKGEMARYRVSENSMVRRDPSAMSRGKKMVFKKYIFYPKSPRRVRLIFLKRYLLEILMK